MKKIYSFILVLCCILIANTMFGQIRKEGTPASIKYQIPAVKEIIEITTNFDYAKITEEDRKHQSEGKPVRGGISVPVNKGINDIGVWENLPDGRVMWRVSLKATGTRGLGVVFTQFHLPENSELYLYNADQSMINGALGSHNNNPDKVLSTQVLYGDIITIEYIEYPTKNSKKSKDGELSLQIPNIGAYKTTALLHIGELMFMYHDIYQIFDALAKPNTGSSYSCHNDINCPAGNNWQIQKRGVAHTLNKVGSNWFLCSGSLVNNTAENFIPYF